MRASIIAGAMALICTASSAKADIYGFKVRFSVNQDGAFSATDYSKLSPKDFGDLETAGSAAFGVSISQDDVATDMPRFRALAANDVRSGTEHRGMYKSPEAFAFCKAKIDWNNAELSGQAEFSGSVSRHRLDSGFLYAAKAAQGSSLAADVYLEFVPSGTTDQFDCFSRDARMWKCKAKVCSDKGQVVDTYGIYPPARFP